MRHCPGRPGHFLDPSLAGVTPAPMHPKTTCRGREPLVEPSGSPRATSFQLAMGTSGPDLLRQYYGIRWMGQCCILTDDGVRRILNFTHVERYCIHFYVECHNITWLCQNKESKRSRKRRVSGLGMNDPFACLSPQLNSLCSAFVC
jgi:hypothetical protein